ncbi:hypothetical protein TNIN_310831 [Trichonephila inaurata madagascariensis]|uniref:Secreted protein n=1 Tax=Trichonephila inaurata madagascariensis TaxID=2747483 RepID=A0A8X7C7Q6_9ARAC|nr:hypothetical protein TNIN_310831 [Trichonephila inaurata madagascariensis]
MPQHFSFNFFTGLLWSHLSGGTSARYYTSTPPPSAFFETSSVCEGRLSFIEKRHLVLYRETILGENGFQIARNDRKFVIRFIPGLVSKLSVVWPLLPRRNMFNVISFFRLELERLLYFVE